ncbi:MAG TPA: S41 family peptidase [Ignavibacteriaceae bacterium]
MKLNNWKSLLTGTVVILLFSGFFPGQDDVYFQISKSIDLFGKVYKEISLNYVDNVNPEQFMRAGIEGMLGTLDPYTIFIDGDKKDEIDLITSGKYGGVGISIGVRGSSVTVVEVLDGYSAQRQGIRIGDEIIAADSVRITPENIDDVSQLVKGEPGTSVNLTIVRNEEQDTINFNLIREEVIVKNLTYYGFMPVNSNNAYLKLSSFSRSAASEVLDALKELKAKREIKSIVLDLRGNPGGLLDVAVDICDKFLPKGDLIVTTKGRDNTNVNHYYAEQEPFAGNAKLVVLINEGSASASEIVAGALQDHDRGVIIGTKSYGKGLVQTITPLSYNTSLKITTAKYYTPSGRCIQKINYAENNKVITDTNSILNSKYLTDNKRAVYGAGGITPDSTVGYKIEGDLTLSLLAKGMFFKFADHYYYNHPNDNFATLRDDKLYTSFEKYLNDEKFEYSSDAEKEVNKLIADAEDKKLDSSIRAELQKLKEQFNQLDGSEYKIYKAEIIRELKAELAARYLGSTGRIEEALDNDPQFQAAVSILSNDNMYNRLLNIK